MAGLTDEQIRQYQDQGYVLIPGLFDAETLDRLDARFQAFVRGEISQPDTMKIMRDVMVVKGAVEPESDLHAVNKMISFEDDPALYEYARYPALLTCVRSLLGDDVYSVSTNVFNKPPNVDGRHPMHQDLRYFRIRPASGIVGVWTAMLPATRESGCLAVIPGSHTGELLEHDNPDWEYVNHGFFGVDADLGARVHVEMAPGDTLLFHPLLIHGSGHNRSRGFRRAISAHYASASCESPSRDWRVGKQARAL